MNSNIHGDIAVSVFPTFVRNCFRTYCRTASGLPDLLPDCFRMSIQVRCICGHNYSSRDANLKNPLGTLFSGHKKWPFLETLQKMIMYSFFRKRCQNHIFELMLVASRNMLRNYFVGAIVKASKTLIATNHQILASNESNWSVPIQISNRV